MGKTSYKMRVIVLACSADWIGGGGATLFLFSFFFFEAQVTCEDKGHVRRPTVGPLPSTLDNALILPEISFLKKTVDQSPLVLV